MMNQVMARTVARAHLPCSGTGLTETVVCLASGDVGAGTRHSVRRLCEPRSVLVRRDDPVTDGVSGRGVMPDERIRVGDVTRRTLFFERLARDPTA